MSENNRMLKKPVSKARESEGARLRRGFGGQAGLSTEALAKVEAYSST